MINQRYFYIASATFVRSSMHGTMALFASNSFAKDAISSIHVRNKFGHRDIFHFKLDHSSSLSIRRPFPLPTTAHRSQSRYRSIHSLRCYSGLPSGFTQYPCEFRIRFFKTQLSKSSRLFGSNPNGPNPRPGNIFLADERDEFSLPSIDMAALHRTIDTTRDIIGYPTYDVTLMLVSDDFMREANSETRGVDAPTDVLSFCFQDNFVEPGVLSKALFDIPEYYNLGDILINVAYIERKCAEDKTSHEEEEKKRKREISESKDIIEGQILGEHADDTVIKNYEMSQGGSSDGEYEYIEVEVDEYDDRGVAPAMLKVYDPEIRVHMLVVHGMLHLVGYDHIDDDDYELMVVKEDEVLRELEKRLGLNFGMTMLPPNNFSESR